NLRTVARAVEVMARMSFKTTPKEQGLARFNVVSVDEAPRSSEATGKALREAGFNAICFEDARLAREHLAANSTELIIANLALPEAHGLSLTDIRQLPLHEETPVIFGPDSTSFSPTDEELPTSAPRLDADQLLLAELVVKALNEVQGPE